MLQYKKIKLVLILLLLLTPVITVVSAPFNVTPAFAAVQEGAGSNNGGGGNSTNSGGDDSNCVEIGVKVPGEEDRCVENGTGNNNPIFLYLRGIIQFLAAGVGIAITISIVIGGIQYMTSRGNPQATQAALSRITNAVIALILFILMAAILNFLIPGGLF